MKFGIYLVRLVSHSHITSGDDVINRDVTSRTGIRSTMATFTAVEQRAYIKIEYYRDTKRVKILNTLKSVCGKDALPKTTVYRWTDEFKKGICWF